MITNGIDFEEINNKKPFNSIAKNSILYIGVLEYIKGVDILLRSISVIKEKIPNIILYIAGSGQQEKQLKELVEELKIERNVKFLGYISEEKYSYFKSVDIVAIPSRSENLPFVLLEAMACGTPVVASNVGGIPSILIEGRTGLLFEKENINDLAEKIIFLMQNKELRKEIRRVGIEKSKEFAWDKITDKTVEVYEKILHECKS